MRLTYSKKVVVLSAAALFAITPVAWCANSNSSQNQKCSADSQNSQQADKNSDQAMNNNARPGWVLVDENFVMLTANEPQNHFIQAEQDLMQHDNKGAASEIRLGAAYMTMQASRSQGPEKQALDQAANDVRQAAHDISQQKGKSSADLKQTFAKADGDLATYFQKKAETELNEHKSVMAGYDLQGAANSLAAAYVWSGKQVPNQAQKQIDRATNLAANLIGPDEDQYAPGQAKTAGATSNEQEKQQSSTAMNSRKENKIVQALGRQIDKGCSEFGCNETPGV